MKCSWAKIMIKMIKVLFIVSFVPSAFSAPPLPMNFRIENVNLDNQSASMKCSWDESGVGVNQTWFVDDVPADASTVTTDTDTSSVINLVWDTMEKVAGANLTIWCKGEKSYDNGLQQWVESDEVSKNITVP